MDEITNSTNETQEPMENPTPAPNTDIPAPAEPPKNDNAEMSRLRAALDKASKEAADYKKLWRKSQSEEERRAAEKEEADQAIRDELEQLRKQSAVGGISKRVMAFLGDEKLSDSVAESLYGAEDVDAAIDAIQKAWADREKKLRLEYSKLPAPADGDNAPTTTKADLSKMSYLERLEFSKKYPDTYKKLTT